MRVMARRDDGAFLIVDELSDPDAALLVSDDGTWRTTVEAQLARGEWWVDNSPVPEDLAAEWGALLAGERVEKRDWNPDHYYHNWIPRVPASVDQIHPDYQPGMWQRLTSDLAIEHRARQIFDQEKGYRDAQRARGWDTPSDDDLMDTARTMAGVSHRTGTLTRGPQIVYANGPHRVIVSTNKRFDHQSLLDEVDGLVQANPPRHDGHFRLAITPHDQMLNPAAFGETYRGENAVRISERAVEPNEIPYHFTPGKMPVAQAHQHSPLTYILAHEYGHVLDIRDSEHAPWASDSAGEDMYWRMLGDIPQYAQTSEHHYGEAFAEMFAEWWLSGGTTSNQAAHVYAKRFGWKLPKAPSSSTRRKARSKHR